MADQKITELDADATPTSDDLIVTVNDPGGSPANKKATLGNAMKLAPHLVDRGDPAAADKTITDFPTTDAWTDLDLSGIVPAGATWVYFRVSFAGNALNKAFKIRKNGNSNSVAVAQAVLMTTNSTYSASFFVPCDANRVVEYWLDSGVTVSVCNFTVLGWVIDTIN